METVKQADRYNLDQAWLPDVIRVSDLLQLERSAQEQASQFMGSIAVDAVVECPATDCVQDSLWGAIRHARTGDPEADALIYANAKSDVIERSIKAGMVTKVDMEVNGNRVVQHGQNYRSVLVNSLKYMDYNPIVRRRTKAEVRNGFRMEKLLETNWLDKGYAMVVFSRAENLPQYGFFTDIMACAIQVTTKQGDCLTVESAFVAGADQGIVFDQKAVGTLYAELAGEDVSALDPAGIIDKPLLVHRSLLENGVIDLVKMYDANVGGTFFGLRQPIRDYLTYRDACRRREEELHDLVRAISDELIEHAADINSPVEASRYLDKISEKHLLRRAIIDRKIDPEVFGRQAAHYIHQARDALDNQNHELFDRAILKAAQYALSNSCPGGFNMLSRLAGGNLDIKEEDAYGPLEFQCPNGCLNHRQYGQLLDVCRFCGASVKCGNSSPSAKPQSRIINLWEKIKQPQPEFSHKN